MMKTHVMMTKGGLSASIFSGNSGFNEISTDASWMRGPLNR